MTPPIDQVCDHVKKCTDSKNSESNATRSIPLKSSALTFDRNYGDNIMEIFNIGGPVVKSRF
jgi:hypothetical protein